MSFKKAALGKSAGMTTENGMPTPAASANRVLDLFFKQGGLRGRATEVLPLFIEALKEDALLALKCMFYNRDVRGGQGERETFRVMYKWLSENQPQRATLNLKLIPEYGRWDDVLAVTLDTPIEKYGLATYAYALREGNALAAKWAPSENKAHHSWYLKLHKYMGITPQEYRTLLTNARNVVESKMCSNEWDKIIFNHIPSVALGKYRTAWFKHQEQRYTQWLADLKSGAKDVKVNAGAIHPHEIVRQALMIHNPAEADLADVRWKALPNYMAKGVNALAMCDVSGSMGSEGILISTTVGAYIAERNTGSFQDLILTFSARPRFVQLSGTIVDRANQILRTDESPANTNFEAAIKLILATGVKNHIKDEDMPKFLFVISDMQMDEAVSCPSKTAHEMMCSMYRKAGYTPPTIVYWNVRTSRGVPVQFDEAGTALVSGFSPTILKAVLGANLDPQEIARQMDPITVMMTMLESARYISVSA